MKPATPQGGVENADIVDVRAVDAVVFKEEHPCEGIVKIRRVSIYRQNANNFSNNFD